MPRNSMSDQASQPGGSEDPKHRVVLRCRYSNSDQLWDLFGQVLADPDVAPSGPCKSEEHDDGAVQPDHVLTGQPPDPFSELGSPNGGDLVDHETADVVQPVLEAGLYDQTEERRLGGMGGEGTDGHRVGRVEAVVLDDDRRPGLAGIPRSGCRGPDLAAGHSSSAEMASMNSWSSRACVDDATSAD